jgi:HAD superfamily hydrolase (TIGR01490 family)
MSQDNTEIITEVKPFAVFDIDGTLIRWQLYHAIVDKLVKAGKIDPKEFEIAHAARMEWKARTHVDAFKSYERTLVELYDKVITHISYEDYIVAVDEVYKTYRNQTYIYTRDLIEKLKAQGYIIFAISASQIQAVELLAKYYGFDDWGGSEYEILNGHFTGESTALLRHEKPKLLKQLIEKHGASYAGSIAVGDSEGDIPMLEIVEQPIAFNPTQLLFEHAKQHSWKVVIERKNMIYELEARDGSYILA